MGNAGITVSSRRPLAPIDAGLHIPPTALRIPPATNGRRVGRSGREAPPALAQNSGSRGSRPAIARTPGKVPAPGRPARETPPAQVQVPELSVLPHEHATVHT